MTTKTKKILLVCALTLSAAVLLFFGCKKGVELYNAKNADELFAAGDYAGAREWYEKNGSAEDIARCDYELDREAYEAAAAQLAAGEYDRGAALHSKRSGILRTRRTERWNAAFSRRAP